MSEMSGGMMGASQAAMLPEKLALREKMMTAHLEALRKFKAAVEPLYAALMMRMMMGSDGISAIWSRARRLTSRLARLLFCQRSSNRRMRSMRSPDRAPG